jgi:hypothetical protein
VLVHLGLGLAEDSPDILDPRFRPSPHAVADVLRSRPKDLEDKGGRPKNRDTSLEVFHGRILWPVVAARADSSADCTADPESGAAPRPAWLGGGVWFLTSHPQRQGHEVKNQTKGKGGGTGRKRRRRDREKRKDQRRKRREEEGRGRKESEGERARQWQTTAGRRERRERERKGREAAGWSANGASGRSTEAAAGFTGSRLAYRLALRDQRRRLGSSRALSCLLLLCREG